MQNIRQLLDECGAAMGHVTKLVVYLTDIRHREAVYRTMGEYIIGVHPVCTGLVVVALARPGMAGGDRCDRRHSGRRRMTFSIAARCAETGMLGVAVSSSSPAVAARCAYARADVGAICSQNVTDPRLGTRGLELLAEGMTAGEAIETLVKTSDHIEYRQLAAVDARGGSAVYSGPKALGVVSFAKAQDVACAGNLLASKDVPRAMMEAFVSSPGPLGDRLLIAMRAGRDAGGEAGPVHSAGLMLVRDVPWPVADLARRLDRGPARSMRSPISGRSMPRSSTPTSSAPSIRARPRATACRATNKEPERGNPFRSFEAFSPPHAEVRAKRASKHG